MSPVPTSSEQPRVLILSAAAGNGHLSAAKALELTAKNRGLQVRNEDVLAHSPKLFQSWFQGGYERLVKVNPPLWGMLYRTSDRPYFSYWFQTSLDWTFCSNLEELILDFEPTWVLCTHSLPLPRLRLVRRRVGFKVAVVITDLHPHRMWLRGYPDQYFVPVELTKRRLLRRAPWSEGKIEVTGMPIHPAFGAEPPRPEANQPPTMLLTAGGIGGGPLVEVARELAKTGAAFSIVTGRNAELRAELEEIYPPGGPVKVLGLLSQEAMAQALRAADIIVSKPGGLTTFEALACGCAFVVLRPLLIPGQEEENARFLARLGAGLPVNQVEDLAPAVSDLLADSPKLAAMRSAARQHASPGAAERVIDWLLAHPAA
jgi:processive 1,2-diacylglycerol beta-glucosyltransferase